LSDRPIRAHSASIVYYYNLEQNELLNILIR
jgi:hypothetical protein